MVLRLYKSCQLQNFVLEQRIMKSCRYSVPDTLFSVPASVDSKQLSQLINSLLQGDAKTEGDEDLVKFDFLLDGEILRTALNHLLQEKEVSSEAVIELEYVERQPAPYPENSLLHDDWVSAVQAAGENILSGSYDNTVRLWNTQGEPVMTIPAHADPVKCVAWIRHDTSDIESTFVSGSHDQTAVIWRWHKERNEVDCIHVCKGHSGTVNCVSVSPSKEKMCTVSWDKMLKLWSADCLPEDEPESDRPRKKKKTAASKAQTRVPILTLSGHNDAVTAVQWVDDTSVVTSSRDQTVRIWDLKQAVQSNLLQGSEAIFDVAYSPLNGLLVVASASRHIHLYDPRSKEGAVVKQSFTSHTGWVVSVDWSRNNEHLFLSGAYDSILKLWDIRSPKAPLYNMHGHEDKILSVDWSVPELILSGGADNNLKIHHYNVTS
ncbi:ribosome biogenesis protein WDR12 homolog isoform X1 [Pomacea canaliculata]|uniref:ribosome biogenesis protein WDR12 homolog isoform X1 n=1 Tax=Pomacea canaliculata TaxID=400727 RepID=UPI000D72F43E|nr:ribosome biogenesis protein WDR12 homolog isoform X1 [Pomacea canaliculata]